MDKLHVVRKVFTFSRPQQFSYYILPHFIRPNTLV